MNDSQTRPAALKHSPDRSIGVIPWFSNRNGLRRRAGKPVTSLLSVVSGVALSAASLFAAGTNTWVGNTEANWSTAANWTTVGGSTPS